VEQTIKEGKTVEIIPLKDYLTVVGTDMGKLTERDIMKINGQHIDSDSCKKVYRSSKGGVITVGDILKAKGISLPDVNTSNTDE